MISHLGLPNQEAYGFRPPTHPPPTPGALKDHPSSTKIARCRYPPWGWGGICQYKETSDSGWFHGIGKLGWPVESDLGVNQEWVHGLGVSPWLLPLQEESREPARILLTPPPTRIPTSSHLGQ